MWEVPLETQYSQAVKNNTLAQTTNHNYHSTFMHTFKTNNSKTPQSNKTRFPEDWDRPRIKCYQEKLINQGIQQWYTCANEENDYNQPKRKLQTQTWKTTTVDPSTAKEGKIYSDICRSFPTTSSTANKNIYVTYVYDFNTILTTEMKNKSDKEMIRAFTELPKDFKIRGINSGFHLMDDEASTAFITTMKNMNIKYQEVPSSIQRAINSERSIQTFKKYFIS